MWGRESFASSAAMIVRTGKPSLFVEGLEGIRCGDRER